MAENVAASFNMAKAPTSEGSTLRYPATVAYKQWVRTQMKKRGWTQQELVDAMKRVDRSLTTISTSTITDFLGNEDEIPVPSNSKLLPVINKVFGIAAPPVCDPDDELAQLVDRFRVRWARATQSERDLLRAVLIRGDDDEAGLDGDRNGAGKVSRRGNRPTND